MEQQFSNEQPNLVEIKAKHKSKIALMIIINIVITIIISVAVVYVMQADLRSQVDEIQEKVKNIKVGK